MQNAKDTFYEVVRDRLAALNAERTIAVRGLVRPGVVVDENEMAVTATLPDCFHLRWTGQAVDGQGALPRVTLQCEIAYGTAGTAANGGLDRGRALAAMDGEVLLAVQQAPQSAAKTNYSALANGGTAAPMSTRIWWGEVAFGAAQADKDRLTRVATVMVMAYQEAGEL